MRMPSVRSPNSSLSFRSPAKINWFLQVICKREDGYHEIASLMQYIDLFDEITIEHSDQIEIICDLDIPKEENLVYKAAKLFKHYTSYKKGARITVKKNIPISAGLGGGSSDAAYTLKGLNDLWSIGFSVERLHAIGAEIGSDIPFFFSGPAAFVEGRGEKITPISIETSYTILLVKPNISVSTAWAYSYFDQLFNKKLTKKLIDIKLFCRALNLKDLSTLNDLLTNDLEEAVTTKYPMIQELKYKLKENGALLSAMSGSGPTVFGIFDRRESAERTLQLMKPHSGWIVRTLN